MSEEPMLKSNSDSHQDNTHDGPKDSGATDDLQLKDTDQGSNPPQSINDREADTECTPDPSDAPSVAPQAALKTPVSPGDGAAAPGGERTGRPKGSVQIQEPSVLERHGYRIVKIDQKHGILHRAIPVMPLWLAILLCLLNILLPGTGTLISAFSVFCCGITTRLSSPVHAMVLNLVSGFLQMATFLLIVGWIWSILWGMTFVQLAFSAKEDAAAVVPAAALPYYVRRHSSVE